MAQTAFSTDALDGAVGDELFTAVEVELEVDVGTSAAEVEADELAEAAGAGEVSVTAAGLVGGGTATASDDVPPTLAGTEVTAPACCVLPAVLPDWQAASRTPAAIAPSVGTSLPIEPPDERRPPNSYKPNKAHCLRERPRRPGSHRLLSRDGPVFPHPILGADRSELRPAFPTALGDGSTLGASRMSDGPNGRNTVGSNEPFGLDPEDLDRFVRGAGEQLREALGQFGLGGSGGGAGWSGFFDQMGRGAGRPQEAAAKTADGVWVIYVVDAEGGAQIEQVHATELDALRANKHNTDNARSVRFLPYGMPVSVLDAPEQSPDS